jgi:hypothetical protein
MKAFIKELELISLINNNYEHIQQLETLSDHYKLMKESAYSKEYPNEYNLTQEQINNLFIISKTTQNEHYGMHLYTSIEFQDENNTISKVLKKFNVNPLPSFKELYHNKLY